MSLLSLIPIPQLQAVKLGAVVVAFAVVGVAGFMGGYRWEAASYQKFKAEIAQEKATEIAAELKKQQVFDDIALRDAQRSIARQQSIAAETRRQLEEFQHARKNGSACPDADRTLGVLKRAFPGDQGAGLPAPAGGADGASPPARPRAH